MLKDPKSILSRRLIRHFIVTIEVGLVMLDLIPIISEPIRFGVLFISLALSHNIFIAGLAFGLITLILDILGAIATADLLNKQITAQIITKTNNLLQIMHLNKIQKKETNILTDIGITLLVGTPITLILKQRHHPNRHLKDNLSLGILLSTLAAIISAVQGTAIVAGIWHPKFWTIVLAVGVIISIVIINRQLKRYYGS